MICVRKSLSSLLTAGIAVLMHVPAQGQPGPDQTNSAGVPAPTAERGPSHIWENGIGEGFRSSAQSITLELGGMAGIAAFGSRQAHDLALFSATYGHMLSSVKGQGHWYRGNWELRVELFTGAQFSPGSEWLVGLTPHLRYDFATGTRLIPFIDGGAGVTATGIGPPDLSGTFEFNLQGGGGVEWFLTDHVALSAEVRYAHWSCAGLHKPNLGLNGVTGLLGISWFF